MASPNVGISDIALYIPAPKIELGKIVSARSAQDPGMERRLRRAVESTGQRAIRFPESYEDNASLAASAAFRLLSKRPPAKHAGLR
jgi:hydroxymethylglutaryl-CoA synthase